MADQFRDQINTARRAGYTDDELVGFLKDRDPRVSEALSTGYSPSEILEYLAPKLTTGEEAVRKTGVAVRGLTESLAGPTAGAVAGATAGALLGAPTGVGAPIGAIAGGLAVPTADALTLAYNKLTGGKVTLPSQVVSNWLAGPRAETPAERVLQTTTGALGGAGPYVAAGRTIVQAAKTLPGMPSPVAGGVTRVGEEAARRPAWQMTAAPTSAVVGQTVAEATGSPLAGLAAGTVTGAGMGAQRTKRQQAPSADELMASSKANYELLDKSGFQLDTQQFQQRMAALPAKLRKDVGYVESVAPKVAGAFKELTSNAPKDVAELTALRKIIGLAAQSGDAAERKIAKELLDEFDDYVLNAPSSAVVAGDRSAIEAWKAARADYAKVKKAELIEDIVYRAEVSQGSKENTIAQGLSALAKNQKKMRFFTPDEQEAIREAAKGGKVQAMLHTAAKFTPMTPAAAIFTAVSPFGAYTAAAGMGAKELATRRRLQTIDRLTNRIRLGAEPEVLQNPFSDIPIFGGRAAQNMLAGENQNRLVQR